jgi:hypothetical protein
MIKAVYSLIPRVAVASAHDPGRKPRPAEEASRETGRGGGEVRVKKKAIREGLRRGISV